MSDEYHLLEIAKQIEEKGVPLEEGVTQLEAALQQSPPEAIEKIEKGGSTDIRVQLQTMSIPDKMKLAMFGPVAARSLLIFDPNKLIAHLVLKNPKIGLNEVEDFAKNPNTPDYVLRALADRKEWMKSYSLKCNLVMNPKTPGDVALKWLRYLNANELKKIARSKNLPQLIAVTAKKRVAEMK